MRFEFCSKMDSEQEINGSILAMNAKHSKTTADKTIFAGKAIC